MVTVFTNTKKEGRSEFSITASMHAHFLLALQTGWSSIRCFLFLSTSLDSCSILVSIREIFHHSSAAIAPKTQKGVSCEDQAAYIKLLHPGKEMIRRKHEPVPWAIFILPSLFILIGFSPAQPPLIPSFYYPSDLSLFLSLSSIFFFIFLLLLLLFFSLFLFFLSLFYLFFFPFIYNLP